MSRQLPRPSASRPHEPVEFEADPNVMVTSEGMRVVSLQQVLNGIEVWAMAPKVWLFEDGTVDRVIGDTVSAPANLPVKPTVPAEVALRVAAAKAAEPRTLRGVFGDDELPRLDVSDSFTRLSYQARNDQPMTFGKGPFEEAIPARLVYLYMGDDARLTWMFTLSREKLAAQYQAFVEADDRTENPNEPQILYFYDTVRHAVAGRVFQRNPAESTFDTVPFPLPHGRLSDRASHGVARRIPAALGRDAPREGVDRGQQRTRPQRLDPAPRRGPRRRRGQRRLRPGAGQPRAIRHQHLLLLQFRP